MKSISKWRYPKFELTEESKEEWVEEFKEINSQLIKNLAIPLDDFWLNVILAYHIEKKKKQVEA